MTTQTQTVQVGDRAKLVRTAEGLDGLILAGTILVIGERLSNGTYEARTPLGRRLWVHPSNLVVVREAMPEPAAYPPGMPVWLAVAGAVGMVGLFIAAMAATVAIVNGY